MSRAAGILDGYYRRTGQPRDNERDAVFAYERTMLRNLMTRLEVILEDEGVDQDTADRVMRCLVYGSADPDEAERRMRQHDEMVRLMTSQPPSPLDVAGLLGMPPG